MPSRRCLLLSREWRDGPNGVEVTLWGRAETGPVHVVVETDAVMFVPRRTPATFTDGGRRAPVELRSLQGEPVDAVYFSSQRALLRAREGLRAELLVGLESDVKPSDRWVMERFVSGGFEIDGSSDRRGNVDVFGKGRVDVRKFEAGALVPGLTRCSLDIETDGDEIVSVALVTSIAGEPVVEEVILVKRSPAVPSAAFVTVVRSERALCELFVERITELDPDLLIGWNVLEFDLTVLERRAAHHRVPFTIGRLGKVGRVLAGEKNQVSVARIPGRVVLDGIATLKNATWTFERFSLEYVARELLGRGKRIDAERDKVREIARMSREDPDALAAYNLEDARLVVDVFEKAQLVEFAFARAELVGLPPDRQGGSVHAFDHLYLPLLHRAGYVAPDVGSGADPEESPGGEVLDSVPGLHANVLAFDFRSLYPSIIRTFMVDPLGLSLALGEGANQELVPGFDGGRFVRDPSILPRIIDRLTVARKQAIDAGNEAFSRAIKIHMNSFYGVLGTPGCRFFDPRLASSITRRGHEIIRRLCAFFEDRSLRVLYGDTDSVFVLAPEGVQDHAALGSALAREVNVVFREELRAAHDVESALELRFDGHFRWFLMPTMRGSEVGSKKRYAGLVARRGGEADALVIKGLEAVRTDWTPLARRAQRELLRRVFAGESWREWLLSLRTDLFAGRCDRELVYKKRIRRELAAYGNAPPHVRAARMLREGPTDWGRGDVEYLMTARGPVPEALVFASGAPASIDYAHYLDKQLAPACDVVLTLLGTSFGEIAGTQLKLFS